MIISKICFLVNYNLYESKRHFTKKLAEALEKLSVETLIIDLQEAPIEIETALEIKNFDPDLTCSYNAIPPLPSGKYLWDLLEIPHLSLLVDPAIYSVSLVNSPFSLLTCVDRADLKSIQQLPFNRIFFWPHAADHSEKLNEGERQYDVVFIGSCYDFESIRDSWKERFSQKVQTILSEAAEQVLSERMVSMADALVNSCERHGVDKDKTNFLELFYELDHYCRGADRVNLVRAITDAPVHIFGETMTDDDRFQKDWHYYVGSKPNVTILPSVDFHIALQILSMSKICLNSVPSFKDGSHERVFNSLAQGALPLSSSSFYLQECFKPRQEALFYHPGHWKEANDQVEYYLANESKRAQIAKQGRAKVLREHTWDARAKTLLDNLI